MHNPLILEIVVEIEVESYTVADRVAQFLSDELTNYVVNEDQGHIYAQYALDFCNHPQGLPPRGLDTLAWGYVKDAVEQTRHELREERR